MSVDRKIILQYLNGYRGLAVVLLVFGHYSIFFKDGQDLFSPVAKIGVILFFILSAYLLTREMLARKSIDKEVLTSYFIKRIFRIYPVLIVTLILLSLIPSFSKNMFGGREWSFIDNFFLIYPEGNFWAISVEFEYYLIIPILCIFVIKNIKFKNIIALILILISIYLYYYVNFNYNIPPNYPHIFPHISPFLFGSAIALYDDGNNTRYSKSIYSNLLCSIGTFGLIYAVPFIGRDILSKVFGSEYLYHNLFANPLGVSISGSLLLLGLINNHGIIKKIFCLKILEWLGLMSFSIYCLHILPLSFQGEIFSKYGNKIGVLYLTVVTIVISAISYFLIEKRIKNNISTIIIYFNKNYKKILLISIILILNLLTFKLLNNNKYYSINIDITSQTNIGCLELYINNNYEKPLVNCDVRKGSNLIEFKGIKSANFSYRIDLGDKKDQQFKINRITLTSENEKKELFSLNSKEISVLGNSGLKINTNGDGLTIDGDPRIYGLISGLKNEEKVNNYFDNFIIGITLLLNLILIIKLIIKNEVKSLCLIGMLVTVACSYPGSYNFDELYTLSEYWNGTLSDLHPINQTLVWATLHDLMAWIGFSSPVTMSVPLLIQASIFWYCAYYFASKFSNRVIKIIFIISLIIAPTFLVFNGHIGKDSQLAVALLFSVTLLLKSKTNKSKLILAISLIPIFYAWGLRSNASIAVIPIATYFLILYFEYIGLDIKINRFKFIAWLIFLLGIIIITNKILNDRFVANKCCYGAQMQMTPIYDLMGISYSINKNLIPSEYYSKKDYSIVDIKNNYNLYNVNWDGLIIPNMSMLSNTLTLWIKAIYLHPTEYFDYRLKVLKNFYGFTLQPTGYEYMFGTYNDYLKVTSNDKIKLMVDNKVDFTNKYLGFQKKFVSYLSKTNNIVLYKIWIYILFTIIILLILKLFKKEYINDEYSILFYSGILFCLPFIVLANSSHFRYVWWTAVALYFYIFIKIDLIVNKLVKKNNEK
jgi:peptidoglycan/LPS O-acetylase OafA/YrhL